MTGIPLQFRDEVTECLLTAPSHWMPPHCGFCFPFGNYGLIIHFPPPLGFRPDGLTHLMVAIRIRFWIRVRVMIRIRIRIRISF